MDPPRSSMSSTSSAADGERAADGMVPSEDSLSSSTCPSVSDESLNTEPPQGAPAVPPRPDVAATPKAPTRPPVKFWHPTTSSTIKQKPKLQMRVPRPMASKNQPRERSTSPVASYTRAKDRALVPMLPYVGPAPESGSSRKRDRVPLAPIHEDSGSDRTPTRSPPARRSRLDGSVQRPRVIAADGNETPRGNRPGRAGTPRPLHRGEREARRVAEARRRADEEYEKQAQARRAALLKDYEDLGADDNRGLETTPRRGVQRPERPPRARDVQISPRRVLRHAEQGDAVPPAINDIENQAGPGQFDLFDADINMDDQGDYDAAPEEIEIDRVELNELFEEEMIESDGELFDLEPPFIERMREAALRREQARLQQAGPRDDEASDEDDDEAGRARARVLDGRENMLDNRPERGEMDEQPVVMLNEAELARRRDLRARFEQNFPAGRALLRRSAGQAGERREDHGVRVRGAVDMAPARDGDVPDARVPLAPAEDQDALDTWTAVEIGDENGLLGRDRERLEVNDEYREQEEIVEAGDPPLDESIIIVYEDLLAGRAIPGQAELDAAEEALRACALGTDIDNIADRRGELRRLERDYLAKMYPEEATAVATYRGGVVMGRFVLTGEFSKEDFDLFDPIKPCSIDAAYHVGRYGDQSNFKQALLRFNEFDTAEIAVKRGLDVGYARLNCFYPAAAAKLDSLLSLSFPFYSFTLICVNWSIAGGIANILGMLRAVRATPSPSTVSFRVRFECMDHLRVALHALNDLRTCGVRLRIQE